MHDNSLQAFDEERHRTLSPRENQILDTLKEHGSMTDREVLRILGFTDMNSVRPRITELKRRGLVREVGDQVDDVTGKQVRIVQAVMAGEVAAV